MQNNLYLIGMPGSGKSTLGKQLALDLGKGFVDFDDLIEKTANMSVGALLKELGDNMFLGYEKNLALGMDFSNSVIALSGSVSLSDEVMEFLKPSGPAIYIKTSIDIIKKRIPLMKTDRIIGFDASTIDAIYETRKLQYEKWAAITYENTTDGTPEEVFEGFKQYLKSIPPSATFNVSFNQDKRDINDLGLYSKYTIVGDFMYLSGQVAMDYETQNMVQTSLDAEFKQAFKNAKMILLGAGYGPKDVIKATIYLTDFKNYDLLNSIYSDYFILKPARSVVEVKGLPRGANIMVDLIAFKDPNSRVSTKRDWSPGKSI